MIFDACPSGGDYVTLVTVNSLFFFYFQLSATGENALTRSVGIKMKWAITLQCDISEAMEMKKGSLIWAAVIWL